MRVLLKIKRADRVGGPYVTLVLCMEEKEYVRDVLGARGGGEE